MTPAGGPKRQGQTKERKEQGTEEEAGSTAGGPSVDRDNRTSCRNSSGRGDGTSCAGERQPRLISMADQSEEARAADLETEKVISSPAARGLVHRVAGSLFLGKTLFIEDEDRTARASPHASRPGFLLPQPTPWMQWRCRPSTIFSPFVSSFVKLHQSRLLCLHFSPPPPLPLSRCQ